MLAGHHEGDQGDQLGVLAAMGPPESTGRRHGHVVVAVGGGGSIFKFLKIQPSKCFSCFKCWTDLNNQPETRKIMIFFQTLALLKTSVATATFVAFWPYLSTFVGWLVLESTNCVAGMKIMGRMSC